jgi:thiol-disulfide isomerase/thioredoxin
VTRRWRILLALAILVALQLGALLAYRAVEASRRPRVTFAAEPLRGDAAPAFEAARADGAAVSVRWPAAPVRLVHFWATWCAPCRDELPGLLAFGRALRGHGLEVVAVAVDDEWSDIAAFFGGAVPPEVVRARDPAAHKRFGVSTLPDSYAVDPGGRLVERFHGARDWRSSAARAHFVHLLEQAGR